MNATVDILDSMIHDRMGILPSQALIGEKSIGIESGTSLDMLLYFRLARGANPGFQSFFMCQPKSGRGVLLLTNSDNGLDLVNKLVSATIPGTHPVLAFPMLHPKD